MLDHKRIELVDGGKQPATVEARLREYDDAELQRHLSVADAYDEPPMRSGRHGRPRKVVNQVVAERMVRDLEAGHSQRWVWRKYRHIQPMSFDWVNRAWNDGRLQKMAVGEAF